MVSVPPAVQAKSTDDAVTFDLDRADTTGHEGPSTKERLSIAISPAYPAPFVPRKVTVTDCPA